MMPSTLVLIRRFQHAFSACAGWLRFGVLLSIAVLPWCARAEALQRLGVGRATAAAAARADERGDALAPRVHLQREGQG